jgi:hypothetical protein
MSPMWNAELVARLEAERVRLNRSHMGAASREEIAELVAAVYDTDREGQLRERPGRKDLDRDGRPRKRLRVVS